VSNKKIVYKQVYDILNILEDSRVPEEIMLNLQNKMDTEYEFDIQQEEIEEEAKNILSEIYTDYLETEEEKEVILKLEKIQRKKEEQIKSEKYDVDVFKEKSLQKAQVSSKQIIKKEKSGFIKKVLKWLNKILKRQV